MRVLVTGGAGFIGSHTADLLLSEGYQVRVLDSLAPPVHEGGVVPDYLDPRVEFLRGDVRDSHAWEQALADVHYVFHLAAYQDYLLDFSRFFDVNCVGTALLYELMVERELPIHKVVVASSQAVYGEGRYRCAVHGTQRPPQRTIEQLQRGAWNLTCPQCDAQPGSTVGAQEMESQLTGEEVVNPHNQYAISKYTQEMTALRLGKRYEIPTVAMRYSITQGPRQSPRNAYSGILRIFTTRLLDGLPPVIYEDGMQLRDYVSVSDVARANILVMKDPRADYRVFNVGSGQAITVLDYALLLMKTIGIEMEPVIQGQFRVGDTRHIVSDISELRRLGWEPHVPLPEVMRQYVDWVRGQRETRRFYLEAASVLQEKGVVREADAG
jgi:dTDP-L-rhamnose 4-epimerase